MFVWAEIQSAPVFVRRYNPRLCSIARSLHCNSSSWHRAALLSFTTFATLAAPPIKDPRLAETYRFVSLLEVSAFSSLFSRCLLLRFHVHTDLSLDFHHCPDGNCGNFHAQSQISHDNVVLALYRRVPYPQHVYRWDRSEKTQCRVLGTLRPANALVTSGRFVSRVPGPQNW